MSKLRENMKEATFADGWIVMNTFGNVQKDDKESINYKDSTTSMHFATFKQINICTLPCFKKTNKQKHHHS